MVELHTRQKSFKRELSSVSASDGAQNLDSASFSASEMSSPQKNQKVKIETLLNMFKGKTQVPNAVSQNYFGNDVSEISSQSVPSYKQSSGTIMTSQMTKSKSRRLNRKEQNLTLETDQDQPPEKLKETDLRPTDKEDNGNFEMFWQVIRKQEELPYQSSNNDTVSEEIDLSQLDPNVPVLLEMDHFVQIKLKEGLHELVDEHYDEYERNFDDNEDEISQSQEQVSTLQQVVDAPTSSAQIGNQQIGDDGDWIQGRYIQYDLVRSLVKTKTGGVQQYETLSFNRWTLESQLRQAAIALNEWIWSERIILGIIMLNSILLGVYDYMYHPSPNKTKPIVNTVVETAEIIFTLIYCFEMAVKMVALGIVEGKGCYLRLGWNVIDFSVVVVGFVNFTPQFRNLQPLRAFRMLRPLRIAKKMPAMKVLVPTITGCLKQLGVFWLFLTMYLFIFAVFGIQLFSGITHSRCRLTPQPVAGDWKLAPGPTLNCGGYRSCPKNYTCGSLLDPTVRSQLWSLDDKELYRDTLNPDLNWGISNFDNIYNALIAVHQCLTLEGQYNLMNQAINGYNYYVGFLYYLLMFLVVYQFLLNLSVAIMVGTIYQNDKTETENDLEIMLDLRDKFEKVKDIIGVRTLKPKAESKMIYTFLAWTINGLLQYEPGPEPLDERYNFKIFREIWALCEQPFFKLFYLALLLINLLLLNKFGSPSTENGGLGSFAIQLTIIIVINGLFAAEILIKLIAYTPKAFASESMNFLEITVTVIFFFTYLVDCLQNKEIIFMESWKLKLTQSLIGFNTLRGVRLFSTYLSLKQTRNVVYVMINCLQKVWNYLIPVVIFIYVFTLIGLDVFAGRLYFDTYENSIPQFADHSRYRGVYRPRGNFDTLLNSGIVVFQTFVGDQWEEIFYDSVRGAGYRRAVIYFFFLVSFGNILLMRFTISFVLWSFKKATMQLNIEGKKEQLKRVVAPSIMDKPDKLTNPVLQDHQYDDYTDSQVQTTKQESEISIEYPKRQKSKFDRSIILDQSMSDNSNLPDLPSASLSNKKKRLQGGNILKTAGKESNIDRLDTVNKTVKFDFDSALGTNDDFGLTQKSKKMTRNNSQNTIARSNTMEAQKQNKYTNMEINPDASYITEDYVDYDENREPFCDQIPEKVIKIKKNDFRKLSALPQGVTSNLDQLPVDRQSDKSKKGKTNSDLTSNTSVKKTGGTELLEKITVWSVKPIEEKKVVEKTDEEKEEEDIGKFSQQKAFDWREHMRLSSLFIFHRDSAKRKFADLIAFGGEELRFFTGAQKLVDFYKRRPKTLEELILEAERKKKDDRFIIADKSLDSFEAVQLQFEPEGQKDLPLDNQIVVKEIWRIRKFETFNIKELVDQSVLIDQVRQDRDKKRSFKEKLFANRERFFVDSESNQIKMYCVPWFKPTNFQILQVFVQVSIYLSVGTLILEDPLSTQITMTSLVNTLIDFTCQVVFLYEAAMKIIALGFIYNCLEDKTKIPYIKNMWNALEFVVLVVSWIYLLESNYAVLMNKPKMFEQLGVMRTLRMIRILKPLCQMNEMKKLKIACFCLVGSLKEMMTQILMVGTFILIFSISGQAFFANQFSRCIINGNFEIARNDPRIITKEDCLKLGYKWENPNINFDTIQTSMMGLFQLLLCSGWIETLRNGIDSVGEGLQPKENNKIYLIFYFIVYVIVARLLLTNMFSAILINSMNNVRDRIDGFDEIYKIQRRWVNVQRLMIQFRPQKLLPLPQGGLNSYFVNLVKSKKYDRFLMAIMIVNVSFLCVKYIGIPSFYVTIVNYSSYFFLAIYNIDQVIKKVGLGQRYLTKDWNKFGMVIIIIADICLALEFGLGYKNLVNAALAVRLLRLVRFFKLFKKFYEFRVVYRTMYIVLVQFMYVILLQFFTIYIFAVVGMGFYSKVILQDSYNEIANFRSFFNALILLICCLMGKTWKDVMYELTIQGEYKGVQCVTDLTDEMLKKGEVNGCGNTSAYLFFLIYILTTRMQFLNLFVSFTIDIYLSCCADETEVIKEQDCKLFIRAWQEFDPEASCWIDPSDIPYLVYDLEGNLGKKTQYLSRIDEAIKNSDDIESRVKYFYLGSKQMLMPKHFATQLIDELKLPIYQTAAGDRCHFKDLIIALAKSRLGAEFSESTDLILRSWTDDYNILARPKTNLDESTILSLQNKSVDRDDRPQDIEVGQLNNDYDEQRMNTERGLLTKKSSSIPPNSVDPLMKRSSLRKRQTQPQSSNLLSTSSLKIQVVRINEKQT